MEDPTLCLLFTLDELEANQLKLFKLHLSEKANGIPKGQLESADATDVANQMMQLYGECSVEMTRSILREMNLNANKLDRGGPADSEQKKEVAIFQDFREEHRKKMIEKFGKIYECIEEKKNEASLSKIYTDLYITEGESEGVNTQHEVHRIEMQSKFERISESKINCNDIFEHLKDTDEIRTVMTTGIAGIGKTVCVQKFILDWAEGEANKNVDFIFALPFRQLNLIQNCSYCLHELLLYFHPMLKAVKNPNMFNKSEIIIIFDGLDESKLCLNFKDGPEIDDLTKIVSVNVLITNLIKGNLLSHARIWITSRPAAVKQIPSIYIDRVTEVQGFDDQQRTEYFRKKMKNEVDADRAITQIKRSKSLYIMCHIPVFCWILATVLLKIVSNSGTLQLPQTLTEVYIYFLLTETTRKDQKYGEGLEADGDTLLESNREIILKLSKLAYKELNKGNILFYEDSLKECDIDINEPSLYSGICTQFFKNECDNNGGNCLKRKMFCFVHLSIQEFLAAFFMFYSYVNKKKEVLNRFTYQADEATGTAMQSRSSMQRKSSFKRILTSLGVFFRGHLNSMTDFLKMAVDRSIEQNDGRLDLFLRFLLGISLESNQKLLQALLTNTESSSDSIKQIKRYIQKILSKETKSTERCMNLLLCLLEMKDDSLLQEIRQYVNSRKELTPAQTSTLAYILLVSEDALDEFDLTKYKTTAEGRKRLLVVLRICKKGQLVNCGLGGDSCTVISSALQSENSLLKKLDLGSNPLENAGVMMLSPGLRHKNCRLETLRLPDCKLTSDACQTLAKVLQFSDSHLKELDLSSNDLTDSGVKELCVGLGHKSCKLEVLILSGCLISHGGCSFIVSALSSSNSLTELDLSYNHPGSAGIQMLSTMSSAKLKVSLENCSEKRLKEGLKRYSCELTLDPQTAHMSVQVNDEMKMAKYVEETQPYPDNPNRFESHRQVLCKEPLRGRCYWEVECKGYFVIGVAYQCLRRDGLLDDRCVLGYNKWSWCLECKNNKLTVLHNKVQLDVHASFSKGNRIGVYLDWKAGSLSFYSLSGKSRDHLHTFPCTFTEPLYAAFGVYEAYDDMSFINLCQI